MQLPPRLLGINQSAGDKDMTSLDSHSCHGLLLKFWESVKYLRACITVVRSRQVLGVIKYPTEQSILSETSEVYSERLKQN